MGKPGTWMCEGRITRYLHAMLAHPQGSNNPSQVVREYERVRGKGRGVNGDELLSVVTDDIKLPG
jgi:hypothetical protein